MNINNSAESVNTRITGSTVNNYRSIATKSLNSKSKTVTEYKNSIEAGIFEPGRFIQYTDAIGFLEEVEKEKHNELLYQNRYYLSEKLRIVAEEHAPREDGIGIEDCFYSDNLPGLIEQGVSETEKLVTVDAFNNAVKLARVRSAKAFYSKYYLSIPNGIKFKSEAIDAYELARTSANVGGHTIKTMQSK